MLQIQFVEQKRILAIGSSPSDSMMECYTLHPGFILISDMSKL